VTELPHHRSWLKGWVQKVNGRPLTGRTIASWCCLGGSRKVHLSDTTGSESAGVGPPSGRSFTFCAKLLIKANFAPFWLQAAFTLSSKYTKLVYQMASQWKDKLTVTLR